MAADYTFPASPVVIEGTGELAPKDTEGVLRATIDGPAVTLYDLNGSPISKVTVGAKGAHQAFKADISDGYLDFGSVQIVAISKEAFTAALDAVNTAESALSQAETMQTSKAAAIHTHVASDINATGTPSATTFLRGDNTWATASGGGAGMVDGGTPDSTFTDVILDGGAP